MSESQAEGMTEEGVRREEDGRGWRDVSRDYIIIIDLPDAGQRLNHHEASINV